MLSKLVDSLNRIIIIVLTVIYFIIDLITIFLYLCETYGTKELNFNILKCQKSRRQNLWLQSFKSVFSILYS